MPLSHAATPQQQNSIHLHFTTLSCFGQKEDEEAVEKRSFSCAAYNLTTLKKTEGSRYVDRNRVARFFLVQYTKAGENIPNYH
jgi:hypothetical protein